jgi:hypothetical protein
MESKHKLIIFKRGGHLQCYLDLSMEECQKRQAEFDKSKTEIEIEKDSEINLEIIELEFDDIFYLWTDSSEYLNDYASRVLHKNMRQVSLSKPEFDEFFKLRSEVQELRYTIAQLHKLIESLIQKPESLMT